jgi:hypothetical protein
MSHGKRELTDFYCGMQEIGLWLEAEVLTADPNAMTKMQRINDSREKMDLIEQEEALESKTPLTR